LEDLGRSLDPPTADPPAYVRLRVLAGTRARPPRLRLGWRLAGASGLAAVVAGGLFLAQYTRAPYGDGQAPPDTVSAAQILHDAAMVARNSSSLDPRPDQFVFMESVSQSGPAQPPTVRGPVPTFTTRPVPPSAPPAPAVVDEEPHVSRTWLSPDGTRDGLTHSRIMSSPDEPGSWDARTIDACRDGRQVARDKDEKLLPGRSQRCLPRLGYLGSLPTDPAAMLRYLYTHSQGQNGPDVEAFDVAGSLLLDGYVPPAALAALFEAVARIPGVSAARNIPDAAGRRGIAVVMAHHGMNDYLVFDAGTHEYLGRRQTVTETGETVWATARLRVGVTDQVGQVP
jgi:hypothetical protein